MKTLLIVYPHWPPSNLAGIHRPRLIANQLKYLGWIPIVITVKAKYYEGIQDPDIYLTVSKDIEVISTKAFNLTKPHLIGDIGIRAYFYTLKKAKDLIKNRKINFVWIPIPSFYSALLGRHLYELTGISYGIDYIDPWVRDITGRTDWRHKLSNRLARILEPIAVKKASLITGVSYEYYKPVLERNFKKRTVLEVNDGSGLQFNSSVVQQFNQSNGQRIYHTVFPYGFDPKDHQIKLDKIQYPWSDENNVKPWIYAGAFLPNSRIFIKLFFEGIKEMMVRGKWDENIRLYFIGTGRYPGKTIVDYAEDAGISGVVNEDRSRYPYLHILNFLSTANTVMVIGSTEKHYTASKVYQAILSQRPVWAVFHQESSAVQVMEECRADQFLIRYNERMTEKEIKEEIKLQLLERLNANQWSPDLNALNKYSARESARKLVVGMETVLHMSPQRKGEV